MCPVCSELMVVFELEGVEVDRCLTCGGTWLDAGELDLLTRLAGAAPGPLMEALEKGTGEKHGTRRCARCPSKLRLVRAGTLEIDRCPFGHGLWFDRSELRSLISFSGEGEKGAVARFLGDLCRADSKGE